MRSVKFVVALLAALALHLVGTRLAPAFPRAVDLFLIVTTLNALAVRSLGGLSGGLAAGLVHDALSGGPYGLFGFADTIIGYVTARVGQRLIIKSSVGVLLMLAAASLVQQGVLLALSALLVEGSIGLDPLWTLVRMLTSALLGTAFYLGGGTLRQLVQRRRSSRVERLRL